MLERENELETLSRLLDDATSQGGRVVLVRGEAGIGKSTLINRFLSDTSERAHTLLGACDDLLTPQPLGPIWDIARQDPSLAEPLTNGDRRSVMESVLDLLSRSLRPTVLVLEDTQWADEATLDLIRFIGRRVPRANGILILTYRDDEVDADHSLRHVISELPPRHVVRMQLEPLSSNAVASMMKDELFDLNRVLALTDGNPLFVSEVLASGVESVPISVQESVIARASKISLDARRILDVTSVIPGGADLSLIENVLHPTREQFAEAERLGLLEVTDDVVMFRHELQRRAIESSLTRTDRQRINQQVLASFDHEVDPSRLVHHAREANDAEAIVQFAPLAAREAIAIHSTREAVAHFRILEPHLSDLPSTEQAEILEEWARQEHFLDSGRSLSLIDRAVELRRSLEDKEELGRVLMFAADVKRQYLRLNDSLLDAAEAVAIFETSDQSVDLARALSSHALVTWLTYEDIPRSLILTDRAKEIAEASADQLAKISVLTTEGTMRHSGGDDRGIALVEESLRLAENGGHAFHEVRSLLNLAGMCGDVRDVDRAVDFARRASDTAMSNELPAFEADAHALLAEFRLWEGDWVEAEKLASELLGSTPHTAALAWRVLATLQIRRGRSEARSAINHMWSLAQQADVLTVTEPSAGVLAEFMWLSGEDDPAWRRQLVDTLEACLEASRPWPSGAFAFWMWKLGLLETVRTGSAHFYDWIINGEYKMAAEFWHDRSIPYEEGLALMHGDVSEQITAVRIFEDLGARATADRVRRGLIDAGVAVPRGKSQSTRSHAAGLTARQAEVLGLLAQNLTNVEIADVLFISHRTVEHHVSAILMKLDVPDRDAAVDTARVQGVLTLP